MGSQLSFAAIWINGHFSRIPKVKPRLEDPGPRTPDHGPCALGLEPLVFWVWIHWAGFCLEKQHLYSRSNFKPTRATALAELRQLLSA